MTNEIHPRVTDINARIAAGENLTDIDSQYLDMIGNGYSPEEADRLVPAETQEPNLAEMMTELLRLRREVKADPAKRAELLKLRDRIRVLSNQPNAVNPSAEVTPKISDADWADLTIAEAERLVSAGKALISGGRLMPIHPGTPECEAARFLGMDDLLTHSIRGRAEDIDPGLIHKLQDDGIDDFFSSLSREADAEVTFHTVKLKVTTRYAKLQAKKGPRVVRTYRLPPKASVMNIQRGKHRGHLPANDCGSRLYMMGNPGASKLTPEQMAERRDAVIGRHPGWLRKKFVGQPDNPMSGVPVRNPLPLEMTARYTGHIQLDDRVRATDKWSGRTVEGTVNSIAINDGVETLVGIVTGDGMQYEAPLSEVTKL